MENPEQILMTLSNFIWSVNFGKKNENSLLSLSSSAYHICIKSLLNSYVELSSGGRVLIFGLSLHLLTFFEYASSEGSGKTAQNCRLV